MTANILDASALLHTLPTLLPAADKKLQSPQDALAALIHTALTALGFRLIGADESGSIQSFAGNALPEGWNRSGPGSYALRYKHEQSSLEFLVKVVKLGNRTLINSIAIESDKTTSLDISTNDFLSPSFFPHDLSADGAPPLVHGYISSNRIEDFISQLKLQIVQKLVPGLRKEGYTETPVETNASSSQSRQPNAPPPARPRPEQPPSPPHADVLRQPTRSPLEIGRRDLDPFPRNPFGSPSLFPDNSGDGMFVGPNHPIFGPGMRGPGPGGRGPWGGDGFLPSMGAPPGARFDPIGPGFGAGPGPFPGPFPGRGGAPFGGQEPDNDEFMPPGARDMFM